MKARGHLYLLNYINASFDGDFRRFVFGGGENMYFCTINAENIGNQQVNQI
jgi:hypothetical protein